MTESNPLISLPSDAADTEPAPDTDSLVLRLPAQEDAAAIHQLIAECPPLDLNSVYVYLLLCEHFRHTCVVACRNGRIDGFISAYVLPARPDVLFVWQVAVHARARGQGLGQAMLAHLKQRLDAECALRFIETTVSPGNQPSRGLFQAAARRWAVELHEHDFFDSSDFGAHSHEAEPLLRIGPFSVGDA